MLKVALIAVLMLFAFGVAWFIALPMLDVVIASAKLYAKGTIAEQVIANVETLVRNTFVWVGVAVFVVMIVWLIVYAFRREVDTYAEYPKL